MKCSRVLQVYKKSCLRDALRRDEDSQQYLTRRDHVIAKTGFSTSRRKGSVSRLAHITDKDRCIKTRLAMKGESCEPCA